MKQVLHSRMKSNKTDGVLIVAGQQASFSKIRAFLVGVGEGGGERPENKFQIKFKISMQIAEVAFFLNNYLDGIIDEPLQCGESTNHDDPGSKTGPHSGESKILCGRSNC